LSYHIDTFKEKVMKIQTAGIVPAVVRAFGVVSMFAISIPGAAEAATPAISSGLAHACALSASGAVTCWGWNAFGQLGPSSPAGVQDAVQVSAGASHTCATTSAGAAKCWGNNYNWQLGDGTTTNSSLPRQVTGLDSGVAQTIAGGTHSCALMADKTVKCWGDNQLGQLGTGNTTSSHTAVSVAGLPAPVHALSLTAGATCAIVVGGDVWCWGAGVSDTGIVLVPTRIGQTGLDAIKVGTSQNSTCVITSGGVAKCSSPGILSGEFITFPGLESGVVDLSKGASHTCALMLDGMVWCQGYGSVGQLGPATNGEDQPLTMIPGMPAGVVSVVAGYDFSCVQTVFGAVKCWGNGIYGQLGSPGLEVPSSTTPAPVQGLAVAAADVSDGGGFHCARMTNGAAACWGANFIGQLGDGTFVNRWTAVSVLGVPEPVAQLSAGASGACAVDADSVVRCWGDEPNIALGNNRHNARIVQNENGSPFVASEVSVGYWHRCARVDTSVFCWGQGPALGSEVTRSDFPIGVVGISGTISSLSAGYFGTCAVVNGAARCWGWNAYGQLGDGTTTDRLTPVQPVGLATGVLSVVYGLYHSCALVAGAKPKCWGSNGNGELGNGSSASSLTPVEATLLPTNASHIVLGSGYTCALAAGQVWCVGSLIGASPGIPLPFPSDIVALSRAGGLCAIRASGAVLCWGDNQWGQLGRGTAGYRPQPSDFVPSLNLWGDATISTSAGPFLSGDALTVTATLPGPSLAGTVSFKIDSVVVPGCAAVPVNSQAASCTTTVPLAGSRTISIEYSGDVNLPVLTAQKVITVTGGASSVTSLSLSPLIVKGQTATISVHVAGAAGTPSGDVTISGTGVNCVVTLVGGVGNCSLVATVLGVGVQLTASYGGSVTYRPTSGVGVLNVVAAFDANADGVRDARDGLIFARYLLGIRGAALLDGIDNTGALRPTVGAIAAYLDTVKNSLDIDLDGRWLPTTDGVLLVRYMLGLRGAALTAGAIGNNAFRTAPALIEAYIRNFAD
jgi:alpha-tubulin suppressor-like RCC1 family protein